MRPTINKSPEVKRHRQIGRKVLLADRLSHVLGDSKPAKKRHGFRLPNLQPKLIAAICVGVIVLSVAGFSATQFFTSRAAVAQKAAATEQDKKLKANSEAADACRRKKAEQKADQLGKITYDELYDYGACDKQ